MKGERMAGYFHCTSQPASSQRFGWNLAFSSVMLLTCETISKKYSLHLDVSSKFNLSRIQE